MGGRHSQIPRSAQAGLVYVVKFRAALEVIVLLLWQTITTQWKEDLLGSQCRGRQSILEGRHGGRGQLVHCMLCQEAGRRVQLLGSLSPFEVVGDFGCSYSGWVFSHQ